MASIAHDSASVATALRDLEPLKGARAISLIGDHGGSNSEFVKMAALLLQRNGFPRVSIVEGGFAACHACVDLLGARHALLSASNASNC